MNRRDCKGRAGLARAGAAKSEFNLSASHLRSRTQIHRRQLDDGGCPVPKRIIWSCNLVIAAVRDELATPAQRDPGIRPAPARSLIGCHSEQEIFDAGNVMNCVFLPSLDAVGEACRAFIHVSSA